MNTINIPVGSVRVRMYDDDRVCLKFKAGGFEPHTLEKWSDLCLAAPVNSLVMDVGAYTGLYAISAKLLGVDAVAFEPLSFLMKRLCENASLNNVDVNAWEVAVSDQEGEETLYYSSSVPFTSGASFVKVQESKLKVRTVTLDSIAVMYKTKISAIKIDVEKAEDRVLDGAQFILQKYRPELIVEVLGKPNVKEAMKNKLLSKLPNYKVGDIFDNRNVWFTPCN